MAPFDLCVVVCSISPTPPDTSERLTVKTKQTCPVRQQPRLDDAVTSLFLRDALVALGRRGLGRRRLGGRVLLPGFSVGTTRSAK